MYRILKLERKEPQIEPHSRENAVTRTSYHIASYKHQQETHNTVNQMKKVRQL